MVDVKDRGVARMVERERQELSNVPIRELVVRLSSVAFHAHDAMGAEQPEGVRHAGLAQSDGFGEVSNAHRAPEQLDQNADPALIAEQCKDVGDIGNVEVARWMCRTRGVGALSQVPS